MGEVRRTVGVYERPQNRFNVRLALVAAAVAIAGLGAAAMVYF